MECKSKISEFYKDETVFVTGSTGFLGKAIVEKVLRVCRPRRIYILIRSKKGSTPEERKESLFKEAAFNRLREEVPDFMNKVEAVSGDISKEGLGLSQDVYNRLCQQVTVVFHSAATVNFDENLKSSVRTNVKATKQIVTLCKLIQNLKVVVHISTAYSFATPDRSVVEEQFYSPPIDPETLMKIDTIDESQLEIISSKLRDQWPNTYSFTKAVGENIIERYGSELPIAVFRPAIISGSNEEPEEGWVDNLNGATGVMAGGGSGVLRVLYIGGSTTAQIVPVDFTVNAILAIGYKLGQRKKIPEKPPIYNYAVPKHTGMDFDKFSSSIRDIGSTMPSIKTFWYYSSMTTTDPRIFKILNLLFHIFPAYILDFWLHINKKKTKLIKIYQKVLKFMNLISFFTCTEWDFYLNNTYDLWEQLEPQDQKIFNFDMYSLNWDEYMTRCVIGVRNHIFKEPLHLLPQSKQRYIRLYICHRLLQVLFYGSLIWFFGVPILKTTLFMSIPLLNLVLPFQS